MDQGYNARCTGRLDLTAKPQRHEQKASRWKLSLDLQAVAQKCNNPAFMQRARWDFYGFFQKENAGLFAQAKLVRNRAGYSVSPTQHANSMPPLAAGSKTSSIPGRCSGRLPGLRTHPRTPQACSLSRFARGVSWHWTIAGFCSWVHPCGQTMGMQATRHSGKPPFVPPISVLVLVPTSRELAWALPHGLPAGSRG